MYIDKKGAIIKELQIEIDILKEKVWERDNHKCIFCHKNVPVECACCHYIRRSQGGMRN